MATYPEQRADGSVWEIEYDPTTDAILGERQVSGGTGGVSIQQSPQDAILQNWMGAQAQQQAYSQAMKAADDAYRQAALSGQNEASARSAAISAGSNALSGYISLLNAYGGSAGLDVNAIASFIRGEGPLSLPSGPTLEGRKTLAELQANPRDIFKLAAYTSGATGGAGFGASPDTQAALAGFPGAGGAGGAAGVGGTTAGVPGTTFTTGTGFGTGATQSIIDRARQWLGDTSNEQWYNKLGGLTDQAVIREMEYNEHPFMMALKQEMAQQPSPTGATAAGAPGGQQAGGSSSPSQLPFYQQLQSQFGSAPSSAFPFAPQTPLPQPNQIPLNYISQLSPFNRGLLEAAYSTAGLSPDVLNEPYRLASQSFGGGGGSLGY